MSVALVIAVAGLSGAGNAALADTEDSAKAAEEAAEPKAEELTSSVEIKGAVRFNYFLKTWEGEDGNRERLGDFGFDTIQLGADAKYGPLSASLGYRFYEDYDVLHHGYVGYALSDTAQIDAGVVQAPFGILPFASHGWFLNIGYYLGMEDDYDFGVRGTFQLGDLDLRLAFFKNSEGSYRGTSPASTRYSYDVVPASVEELGYAGLMEDRANIETNQVNVRAAYDLAHGDTGTTEIGVSARVGGLYNQALGEYGYHWAAAAHADGRYGPLHLQLQGITYQFRPSNPAGANDNYVVMGAFDYPYLVASAGHVLSANLAYAVPIARGPVSSLLFYNDYSILLKSEGNYPATHHEIIGMMVQAGPLYTFVDLALGQHHPWVGPSYGTAFAGGNQDETGALDTSWQSRLNVNVGYYF